MFALVNPRVCLLVAALFACGGETNQDAAQDAGTTTDAGPTGPDANSVSACTSHQIPREIELEFDGLTRTTLLAGPSELPESPLPLILNFHGYGDGPEEQEAFSLMSEHALQAGYVVAYPRGTGLLKGWNAGACCGTAASDGVDDVGFVSALIDEIAATACIDPSRVYAVGYSNGGFLSHRLACELSDKIAGIASVAGVIGLEQCTPARTIPVLHMHGTSDVVVSYAGNAVLGFPPVDAAMEELRIRSGCGDGQPTVSYQQGDSTCVQWPGCESPVSLCTVEGGGHTWPGGTVPAIRGTTSQDLDATELLWQFFADATSP